MFSKIIELYYDIRNYKSLKKEWHEKGYLKAQTYFLKKICSMNKTYNKKLRSIKDFYKQSLIYNIAEKDKEIDRQKKELKIQRNNVTNAYRMFEESIKQSDEVCRKLNNQIQDQLNIAAEQQMRINHISTELDNLKRANEKNRETIKKLLALPEEDRQKELLENSISLVKMA